MEFLKLREQELGSDGNRTGCSYCKGIQGKRQIFLCMEQACGQIAADTADLGRFGCIIVIIENKPDIFAVKLGKTRGDLFSCTSDACERQCRRRSGGRFSEK